MFKSSKFGITCVNKRKVFETLSSHGDKVLKGSCKTPLRFKNFQQAECKNNMFRINSELTDVA